MLTYIARRFLTMIPTLFGVSVLAIFCVLGMALLVVGGILHLLKI